MNTQANKYLECAKEQLEFAEALQIDTVGREAAIAAALKQITYAMQAGPGARK